MKKDMNNNKLYIKDKKITAESITQIVNDMVLGKLTRYVKYFDGRWQSCIYYGTIKSTKNKIE